MVTGISVNDAEFVYVQLRLLWIIQSLREMEYHSFVAYMVLRVLLPVY